MNKPQKKERYWSKKAPETAWDAIVIGTGIGGMTTAATLAKVGKKVLLLEQHYVPGGYTHVFRRKGYIWDVGVHIVGQMTPKAMPGRLLNWLTDDRLAWEFVGDVYDEFRYPDDVTVPFHSDPATFKQTLKDMFPSESEGIDGYFDEIKETARIFQRYFMCRAFPPALAKLAEPLLLKQVKEKVSYTAEEMAQRYLKDPKLITIVNAQWGYHGSPPHEAAWPMQALILRHFGRGAYYPIGGAERIAVELLRTVAEAGGWTRIVAPVEEILIEDGEAVGVRMSDGEVIKAPKIISAVGAWPTVTKLLPEHVKRDTWARSASRHPASPAHVCLYLGFKGDIASAGATRQCQWYYDTWSHEKGVWKVDPSKKEQDRCPILFTSFPSLKDPKHDPGPEHRHTGEIVTFVPWETFQQWKDTPWRRRGEDYEAFKESIAQSMLKELFRQNPDLEPLLDYYELSTPLSTDLFMRSYHGAIYGLASTPERFTDPWLRANTPIKNLYLSGSDVALCGVVGAMMGGAVSALALEPVRLIPKLRHLMKSS